MNKADWDVYRNALIASALTIDTTKDSNSIAFAASSAMMATMKEAAPLVKKSKRFESPELHRKPKESRICLLRKLRSRLEKFCYESSTNASKKICCRKNGKIGS